MLYGTVGVLITQINVTGTPQYHILYHILKQSVASYHTSDVLYDTVGVLITVFKLFGTAASTKMFISVQKLE